MPHEPLDNEELRIVREGLAAASLLASEDLRTIFHSLQVEAFAAFTETAPPELSRREDSYNLVRGLKAIESELHARVQRKDEIQRRLDAEAAYDAEALVNDADFGA